MTCWWEMMMGNEIRDAIEGAIEIEPIPQPDMKAKPEDRRADLLEADPILEITAKEPETDIGNGRRFLARYRDTVLHVPNVGFHIYDSKRWKWDEHKSQIRRLCHDTAERIANERFLIEHLAFEKRTLQEEEDTKEEFARLDSMKSDDRSEEDKKRLSELRILRSEADQVRKALVSRRSSRQKHAKSSAGSSKIDNMLQEAQPYITRELAKMDENPLLVNCANGTLEFKEHLAGDKKVWDVKLGDHDQEQFLTKMVPVNYDPDATAPLFDAFLEEMQPSDEIRRFIQRYMGYCITGLTHEQVFAFFHGGGRNGKSTLVDIVCRILDDYSTTVPIETLAGDQKRKGSDATPDLVRLPGSRLVRASEPESNMKFKEAMIKSLTSDEPILIRQLNKEFNEIYPDFKLIISGNHKPQIHNDDNGIWRRVLLVPWAVQLPKERVDKMLGRKLWDEREGIFNWLVQGALSYFEEGLNPPDEVLNATKEYREDSNPIGAFLDNCCDFTGDENDMMAPGEIYAAYDRIKDEQGWSPFHQPTFQRRLPDQAESRGASKQKKSGLMKYVGIRLKPEFIQREREDGELDPDFDPK